MRLNGEFVDDSKVVEKMLIILPDKFEFETKLVAAIEESCDLKKLTVSEMVSKLQAHGQRFSTRMDDATKGVFQAKHKGPSSSILRGKLEQLWRRQDAWLLKRSYQKAHGLKLFIQQCIS
ncbi:hypothetical protein QL285_058485 [Trifolium repens]|nr:hypothetical protein QL285_058485 [Trifolium repens]